MLRLGFLLPILLGHISVVDVASDVPVGRADAFAANIFKVLQYKRKLKNVKKCSVQCLLQLYLFMLKPFLLVIKKKTCTQSQSPDPTHYLIWDQRSTQRETDDAGFTFACVRPTRFSRITVTTATMIKVPDPAAPHSIFPEATCTTPLPKHNTQPGSHVHQPSQPTIIDLYCDNRR